PPIIVDNSPYQVVVDPGDNVTLQCRWSGHTKARISWYRGSYPLSSLGQSTIHLSSTPSSLGITAAIPTSALATLPSTIASLPVSGIEITPNFTHLSDGKNIIRGVRLDGLGKRQSILIFTNVSHEDADTYTCVAENQAGRATANMSLIVKGYNNCRKSVANYGALRSL
ncbi:unnamed protein product, partial [Protopolystoma xenopodis]